MQKIYTNYFLGLVTLIMVCLLSHSSFALNIEDQFECQYSTTHAAAAVVVAPTDLFISEYIEGSASNKYVEIFNGTGSTVDLSNYDLRRYTNGSTSPGTATLSGMLLDGEVIVYMNSSSNIHGSVPTTILSIISHNGNDAYSLYNSSTMQVVDIFGSIGHDPGSKWISASNSTQNQTLVRKSSVMQGITVNPDSSGTGGFTSLEAEWDQFPIDDVSDLGMHTIDGGGGGSVTAICANPTVYLDMNGDITITVDDIDSGSIADSLIITDSVFSCADLGAQMIMLIAYDSLGNADTCTASVTIADTIAPIAVCMDITVYADSNGMATLDSNALEGGSSDNCGIENVAVNPSTIAQQHQPIVGFADLFFSEYIEGSSNNKYLEVYNGTGATVDLSNYELRRGFNGGQPTFGTPLSGMLLDGEVVVYGNSSAVIYLDSVTVLSSMTFNGDDALILYNLAKGRAADIFGVVGEDPGSAWTASGGYSTQNKTLVRRSTVRHGVLISPTGAGFSGFVTLSSQWDVFDQDNVDNLGGHTQDAVTPNAAVVNHIVTDSSGNSATCQGEVTLIDTFNTANAICTDTTLYLDSDGELYIDALTIGGGSEGVLFELDNAIFDCTNKGPNTVMFTATGSDGSTSTCSATVTIVDSLAPIAICRDTILYLDMSGNGTLSAVSMDGGSFDNCEIDSLHLAQTAYTVSDVGENSVLLTVLDETGNMDTCSSAVTVVDTFSLPFVACMDIIVYLDTMGLVSITASDVDDGSTGNITIDSMNFDCSEIGANTVVLTATNTNGTDTCHAIVTVLDTLDPITSCSDITLYLDEDGVVTLDSNGLDAGSTDNCEIVSINLSQTEFYEDDVNAGLVADLFISEYLEDGNEKYIELFNGTLDTVDLSDYQIRRYSNGGTSPSAQTLTGMLPPNAVNVYRNSQSVGYTGTTIILTNLTFNGDDAMDLFKISTAQTLDIIGSIGEDPGSAWTGPDGYSTADADLRRKFTIKEGITMNPISGFPTLNSEWDLFAKNDYTGLGSHAVDTSAGVSVVQTVTDASGNTSTCTSTVLVLDTFGQRVIANCMDITVYLDENGEALVELADVDAGSSGDSVYIVTDFYDCSSIGTDTTLLFAQDTAGNMDSCSYVVTVLDTLAPIPVCQDITVFLDGNGVAIIDSSFIDNGSTDNCEIVSITLSQEIFNISDTGSGPARYPVDLFISEYVEGSSSNKYIELYNGTGDSVDLSDYELHLFGNGSTSPSTDGLTGILLDGQTKVYANSSATVYGGAKTNSSACNFNGDDAVALYKISTDAYVDIFGNIGDDPGSSWIVPATGLSTANMTSRRKAGAVFGVTMDPTGSGNESFETFEANWDDFPNDDVSGLGMHVIDTSGVPGVPVTMIVTDASGNVDSCIATVVVINITATAICNDTTVYLDASGNVTITVGLIDGGSLGDTVYVLDGMLDCSDVGMATVQLVAEDFGGTLDTCMAIVTVIDTLAPTPMCQNITVYYDNMGEVNLDSTALDAGSSDNCGLTSITLSANSFMCQAPTAPVSSDLFISEYVEGSSSSTRYLEVYNGTGSSVDLSNYEIRRYSGGFTFPSTDTLTGTLADGAVIVYMNPGADTTLYKGEPLPTVMTFSGDDAVELYNKVTMSSADIFGRIGDDPGAAWTGAGGYTTANATLARKSSVVDGVTVNPTGTGPGAFITLTTEWDLLPVNDVSGLGSHTVEASSVANEIVTQTVTDLYGNMASCDAVVTLLDTLAPNVITQDITITLDMSGSATIVANDIDNGTTDNCTLDSLSLDVTMFDCSNAGSNTVTLTAIDASGNIAQDTATVFVIPVSLSTVYVDSAAVGGLNGSSWADAFTSLSEALASSCFMDVDTIFIAKGTYFPEGIDRTVSFTLNDSVVVLGGYASGGVSRDIAANPTIISGDAGVKGDNTDNLHHVIQVPSTSTGVSIDGVTIADGYANGGGLADLGAGLFCQGQLTLKNITFMTNEAVGEGSAIALTGAAGDLSLQNCFIANTNVGPIRLSTSDAAKFVMENSEVEAD